MKTLAIDIETYSSVDIRESGVYAYVDAPDFEILLIGYKFENGETDIIDMCDGGEKNRLMDLCFVQEFYPEFWNALINPQVIKTAFNANFERTCLAKYFDTPMPPEEWFCTAVHAATLGLPRSLGEVGEALGLPADKVKDKVGKSLIEFFCKPCKATKTNKGRVRNYPAHDIEKWELFKGYCKQDVVAEQSILERLSPYKITDDEHKLWCFDQRSNDRGIKVDIDFVEGIIFYDEISTGKLMAEAKQITGLSNPNSLAQLKEWLNKMGESMASITKDTVNAKLTEDLNPEVKRILEIRQALGKTSTKKFQAMKIGVGHDCRLRGILQFYGANRTGRWAGRIVQVHNLPQNKIPDIDLARELVAAKEFDIVEMAFGETAFVFSQLIRTAFVASEDCRFIVSDFSAIEARVIAWLAGEQWRLDVFNTHGKIYEASASQMFHVPLDSIKKGSKLRQQGKIAELALGYQGSFGAIKVMDKDGSIPDDEIPMLVSNWRAANPKICKFWYIVEAAAKTCIQEHRTVKIQHGISFSYINHILFIQLPGGRKLAYYDAKIEKNAKDKDAITYAGVEQTTKKWGRLDTYGGKLVENIVQAVARDCLAVAMMRVEAAGYDIVMHVHDEMIVDVPNVDGAAAEIITGIMSQSIPWAPGLPLKGDTYETPFYKKD